MHASQAQTGRAPAHPGLLGQLVSLALPFGYGEQAPLLGEGVPALRITTAPDGGTPPGGDELAGLDAGRLARLGRASELLLTSLDAAVELPSTTDGALYLGDRAVRGWALELLLLAAVVPFAGAALDLLSRCRRRRLPLAPAWRALRRRLGRVARRRRPPRRCRRDGGASHRAAASAAARPAAGRRLARRRRHARGAGRGARLAARSSAAHPAGAGAARGGPRRLRGGVRGAPRGGGRDGARLPVRPRVRAPVALRVAAPPPAAQGARAGPPTSRSASA